MGGSSRGPVRRCAGSVEASVACSGASHLPGATSSRACCACGGPSLKRKSNVVEYATPRVPPPPPPGVSSAPRSSRCFVEFAEALVVGSSTERVGTSRNGVLKERSAYLGPRSSRAGVPRGCRGAPAARRRYWSSRCRATRRDATPTARRARPAASGGAAFGRESSTREPSDEGHFAVRRRSSTTRA